MLSVDAARSDEKTQKTLERLSDTVLGLSAKLVLSNLRVKHLGESLHEQEGRKKKRRKVVDELRASGQSETLFMSPSKIQKTRDIALSREREKEQSKQGKEARAQERATKKVQKQIEAQRKRDERAAAAFARKTAAAQNKAAAQAARYAKKAQKQTEKELRGENMRLQSRSKGKVAAQEATNTMREPVVTEPVHQAKTAKGRPVRRPARFRT